MLYIRQNATHKVVVGPVVAVGDGFTPITNLDVATADEAEAILHDNGTVVDISGYGWAAIGTADGYYHLTLASGITGTVGHMTVVVNDDSLCLPVRADFTVIEEAVYDAMYAASAAGPLQSTTAARKLDVSATGEAGLDFDNIKDATGAHTLTNITVPTTTAVTDGVSLANGAITDASLAGNMEIVFETDFGTNYNTTRNAWVTNAQDFVGTTASDPFAGNVVAASVTAGVTLANGAITDASLAGNMEIVFETDFGTNYNATRNAWVTNAQDFVGTTAADPFNGQVVAASVTAGVTLAAGAITDASLAGNMEIVFETDFGTNYNTTRNAWVTNHTDYIGTIPAAAFAANSITASALATDAVEEIRNAITGGAYALNTTASGNIGIDWANVENQDTTVGLSKTTVNAVTVISITYAGIRNALGMSADDLDAQLDAILAMLDTARPEPGQGPPAVNPDAMTKLDYLYKAWRNKQTQTSSEYTLWNDAGAQADQQASVSDDGTTATRGEMDTGA